MNHDSTHSVVVRSAKRRHRINTAGACLFVGILLAGIVAFDLIVVDRSVTAQSTFPDPNAGCPHAICGEVSPLIPMQSAEAVHMGLVWKRNSPTPKILFHSRFPEYTPNDVADPALIDLAISRGAFSRSLVN